MDAELKKRFIYGAIAVIVALVIALIPPFEGLTQQGMIVLGILIGAILLIALHVFPEFVAFGLMALLWVVVADVPFESSFGGFVNPIFWLILSALGLGVALEQTGFTKRVAFWMLNRLPQTYFGQMLSIYITGFLILGPIVPSSTARQAVVTLPAVGLYQSFGFEERSKGSAGLVLSSFVSSGVIAPVAFMTSCGAHLAIFGTLPGEIQAQVPWIMWFVYALPITIILAVTLLPILMKLYSPGPVKVDKEYVKNELEKLGPMSLREKFASIIALITLLLWISTIWTDFNSNHIAIGALMALLVTGALTTSDFSTKIQWPLLIFIGFIFGVPASLEAGGVTDWIGGLLTPIMEPLLGTPLLFLVVLFFVALALRIISPSFSVPGIILVASLSPVMEPAGISPFLIILVYALANSHWILPHLNPTRYMVAYSVSDGRAFSHAQARPLTFIYLGIALITLVLSTPYWQWVGLIQ